MSALMDDEIKRCTAKAQRDLDPADHSVQYERVGGQPSSSIFSDTHMGQMGQAQRICEPISVPKVTGFSLN